MAACGGGSDTPPSPKDVGQEDGGPGAGGSSGGVGPDGAGDGGSGEAGTPGDAGASLDPVAGHQSGSRLRARVFEGGGRHVFRWFEDSDFKLRCDPRLAEDGQLRCLPGGIAAENDPSPLFSDAGCTAKVYRWKRPACETSPARFILEALPGPPKTSRVLTLKGLPATTPLFKQVAGQCQLVVSPPPSTPAIELYEADGAVDPAAFLTVEQDILVGAGRLRPTGWRAADGAYVPTGLADSEATPPLRCSVRRDQTGTSRCLPFAEQVFQYASADCSLPVRNFFASTPSPSTLLSVPEKAVTCATETKETLYRLGAAYEGGLWSNVGGTCQGAGTTSASWNFYRAGASIDPATYAATSIVEVGTGRLVRRAARHGSDELPLLQGNGSAAETELFDTVLEAECVPGLDAAGQWACIPSARGSYTPVYLDSNCKNLAKVVEASSCAGDAYMTLPVALPSACQRGMRVFHLGPPQAAPSQLHYLDNKGACVMALDHPDSVRPAGAEVMPAELQPLVDTLE